MKPLRLGLRLLCIYSLLLGIAPCLYAEDDSSCCGGQVLAADEECCVDTPYDATSYYCCHGQTFSKSSCPEQDGNVQGGKAWNPDTCFCDCQVFPSMCPEGKFVDAEDCSCTCPPHGDPPDVCSYWNEDTCEWQGGSGTTVTATIVAPTEDQIAPKNSATTFAGLGSKGCPDGENGYTFAWSSVPPGIEAVGGTSLGQKSPQVKFASAGHYVVTFAVTDTLGQTESTSAGINVPDIEIQFNETDDVKKHVVRLKSTLPDKLFKTKGRIRNSATGLTKEVKVVLTNPDQRVLFPLATDSTKELTLPSDGNWKDFEISGKTKSNDIGDAKVEAHLDTAAGKLLTTKPVTVYTVELGELEVNVDSNYELQRPDESPYLGPTETFKAVKFRGSAYLMPEGLVPADGPDDLKNLRIAFVQNLIQDVSPNWYCTVIYDTPTVIWRNSPAPGTQIRSFSTLKITSRELSTVLDCANGDPPLLYSNTPTAICTPRATTGGVSVAKSSDSPGVRSVKYSYYRFTMQPGGAIQGRAVEPTEQLLPVPSDVVADVQYQFNRAEIYGNFCDWLVTFDNNLKNKESVIPLRQKAWSVHADSTAIPLSQGPTSPGLDTAASSMPILVPPISNNNFTEVKEFGPDVAFTY